MHEEVGRLVAQAPVAAGIEAEVGEEAVLGRDGREHPGLEAERPHPFDRSVRGRHEHAGMAVEGDAQTLRPPATTADDLVHDRLVVSRRDSPGS